MKKKPIIAILFIGTGFLHSCQIFGPDPDKILEKIEIKPEFEAAPPIAEDLSFELLEKPGKKGENIRFMAQFKEGAIRDKFLAMNLNDSKLVLRDDGKGADKKAGDNIFSVLIKEDLPELEKEFNTRIDQLSFQKNISFFDKRSIVVLDRKDLIKIDLKKILKDKKFTFPLDLIKGLKADLNVSKTLMITSLEVVEDPTRTFNPCRAEGNPTGVWTFGELMRQLASPDPGNIADDSEVSAFVMNWLNTWMSDATVNSELLPARTDIQTAIINPWLARSASIGAPAGQLSMQFAPFKLIAIVNRLDLRGNSGYGFSNAGEGRFIFTALDEACNVLGAGFNVIFEYGINKKSCGSVKAFAQEWVALNGLGLGSDPYNQALEAITLQFTQSGTNPAKPNQSSLNQIRTNEIALGPVWELREFNLTTGGNLGLVTVKKEPAVKYNAKLSNPDVERLATFINDNQADIEDNNYDVPLEAPLSSGSPTPTTAFLGGKAHTQFPPTQLFPLPHHWNGTPAAGPGFVASDLARHVFSLNTCSGCHGGETQTFFTHVDPVGFGVEATLSGFLTGRPGRGGALDSDGNPLNGVMTVSDPAARPSGSPTLREFNDLERRKDDLNALVNSLCFKGPIFELAHNLAFEPLRMTH